MTKEREEGLNPCKNGHTLGVLSNLIEIGGKVEKDYFIGCIECEEPLKVRSAGNLDLEVKEKASPSC